MTAVDLKLVAGWLLDPAKRKAFYGILGAVGVFLVTLGVATDSLVAGATGIVVAVVDLAALVLASVKARSGNWTAIYAALAVVVGALKAAGIFTDGQASHVLDVLAAGVAIAPLLAACWRTDTRTPTGEPLDEYQGRHGLRVAPERGAVDARRALVVGLVVAAAVLLAFVASVHSRPAPMPAGHHHGSSQTLDQYVPALLKMKCDEGVKNGQDVAVYVDDIDPIVNHNQPQSMHEHDFFGSSGWQGTVGSAANYEDLRSARTLCRNPSDTAGLWTPTMRYKSGPHAGERVPVQQATIYYRGFASQTTHAGSEALPADVRLVAQQSGATGFGLTGWTCGAKSDVTGGQATIPDCTGQDGTGGNTLTAHVNFPSCWNGNLPDHSPDEVGDTRDNADWAYPTSKAACPAAFSRETVQVRAVFQYRYTGDGTDVELASDMGAAPGSTMHVDYWNTWDQPALEQLVRDCVQTPAEKSCSP